MDADQAVVDNARLQVEYSTIRAPINGRAGRIMIQEGNLVKANDTNPLVVINQLSPIYVNFSVPEQFLPQIRAALRAGPAAVDISANGADGKTWQVPGTLAFIDNAVDATTGTVKLRASVPNKDASLWPGQFVHASLTLSDGNRRRGGSVRSGAVGPGGLLRVHHRCGRESANRAKSRSNGLPETRRSSPRASRGARRWWWMASRACCRASR